jgi:hypothetical protein
MTQGEPVTETDDVLDVEIEETPDTPASTRPFRVVTHKPAVLAVLAPFGGNQDIGVSVDTTIADQTLWWMPTDWAVQVLRAGIDLPQLTAPDSGWLAALPERFLNRKVGTLRKVDIPRYYTKHPKAVESHPQLVLSPPGQVTDLLPPVVVQAADLAAGVFPTGYQRLADATLLEMDEMLACVVEVRCWVAQGEVTAAAPYRLGMVGWDSSLFLEMMFNTEGQKLTEGAVDTARVIAKEVDGPPGYALDLGVTADGIVTVLRAWPAWAAEPLHADPAGVFTALAASHDFDHTGQWRWAPDMDVYARPEAERPGDAPPQPTENEEITTDV